MTNLSEHDSSAHVLDAVERHQRLCRQTPNGSKFETAIQVAYNGLKTKYNSRKEAVQERMMTYDMIRFNDLSLDDVLRKVHGRAKEFDRAHPGANVLVLLFAEGKITPLFTMPYDKEPLEAMLVAQKIESLGTNHELYPLVEEIRKGVEACLQGLKELELAVSKQSIAWADEEIAKITVCRQYENNYLSAATEFGRNFAEKLFPNLTSNVKKEALETSNISENAA